MNKLKTCIAMVACTTMFGCATATKEQVNKKINTKPLPETVVTSEPAASLKRVVAIARFTDETKRGNSFFLDSDGNKIGKQASDILSARLASSGKFIMLERSDINLVEKEGNLKDIGANYLIVGSVSQFGRSTVSDVGVFSRNKKQNANATVNIRIVDTNTGEIIYSEEGSGEATSEASTTLGVGEKSGYDLSLDDKALSAAISKLTSNIMNNLLDKPWQSYILSAEDESIVFAGGRSQGINVGDEFNIVKLGKTVKNPQTGFDIQLPGKVVGSLTVAVISGTGNNEVSISTLSSGNIDKKNLDSYMIQEKTND
ncbi:CsgG/HfaB family protein [Vibrio breoganii]